MPLTERQQQRQRETADLEAFISSDEGEELLTRLRERRLWIKIASESESGMTSVTFLDGEGFGREVSNATLSALYAKEKPRANTRRIIASWAVLNYYSGPRKPTVPIVDYLRERLEMLRNGQRDSSIRNL